MLGTQTWGGWMEGADESTELWRHHVSVSILGSGCEAIKGKQM